MYILLVFIVISIFVIYVVIDNRRIKVKRQEINLGNTGKSIKILQISDLHSKVLRNADYIKINALKYDVVAFTGDTFVNEDKEYTSIIEFMKKVNNTKVVLYVDGNNGTKAYNRKDNTLTDFGNKLEKMGIIVLKDKYEINSVIFTNYNAITSKILDNDWHGKYKIYSKLSNEMKKSNDLSIGLAHFPLDKNAIELVNKKNIYYIPDLIIAGHLHGGQIRLPFIGALIIPKSTGGFKLFPEPKLVCGLYEEGKVKQYISRGVGATKHIKLLAFRLFNTPEVDLIDVKY